MQILNKRCQIVSLAYCVNLNVVHWKVIIIYIIEWIARGIVHKLWRRGPMSLELQQRQMSCLNVEMLIKIIHNCTGMEGSWYCAVKRVKCYCAKCWLCKCAMTSVQCAENPVQCAVCSVLMFSVRTSGVGGTVETLTPILTSTLTLALRLTQTLQ